MPTETQNSEYRIRCLLAAANAAEPDGGWQIVEIHPCPDCDGTGHAKAVLDEPCDTCAGEGTDPDSGYIDGGSF